jgi:hypothetical protein
MPGGRAVAAAVLAAVMAAGFAMDTEFAAEPLHEAAGDGLMEDPRGSSMKTRLKALRVAAVSASAVVSFAVSGSAQAQQPAVVQWRVVEGGNGHWYGYDDNPMTWLQASDVAKDHGGHLLTLASAGEWDFVWGRFGATVGSDIVWLGGFQPSGSREPGGGWRWMTSDPFEYTNWAEGCPNDNQVDGNEDGLITGSTGLWNDLTRNAGIPSMIEWSADCNADGIVDYGQCRNGTLPDYDADNIPDCCEQGQECVVGTYPVQWKVKDGGNGHWYSARRWTGTRSWPEARDTAAALGGMLACITSDDENAWISSTLDLKQPGCGLGRMGWHLGGYQDLTATDYVEPAGGWRWLSGEPWAYTAWLTGQNYPGLTGGDRPNNFQGDERFLKLSELPYAPWWDDVGPSGDQQELCGAIIEWSADCNADGMVDYGQILRGEFDDINGNGVPDRICECLGDLYVDGLVNGADLGVLLAYWGPITGTPASQATDINRDGVVNGLDLGILLAGWGACAP